MEKILYTTEKSSAQLNVSHLLRAYCGNYTCKFSHIFRFHKYWLIPMKPL